MSSLGSSSTGFNPTPYRRYVSWSSCGGATGVGPPLWGLPGALLWATASCGRVKLNPKLDVEEMAQTPETLTPKPQTRITGPASARNSPPPQGRAAAAQQTCAPTSRPTNPHFPPAPCRRPLSGRTRMGDVRATRVLRSAESWQRRGGGRGARRWANGWGRWGRLP